MAADFAFDFDYSIETTAPAYRPERQEEQAAPLRKIKSSKVSRRELERRANRKVIRFFAATVAVIALLGIFSSSLVAMMTTRHELEACRKELELYENENVVLQDKLSKIVSAENIDKIATERLGLVKIISGNESYVDTKQENRVLFSQSR